MPTDPGFWTSLLGGMSEGAKIIVLLLVVITVLGGRALKLIDRKLDAAKDQAALAAQRSLPTSNGFAEHVTHSLDEILAGQERQDRQIARLQDFARTQHPESADELDSTRTRRTQP